MNVFTATGPPAPAPEPVGAPVPVAPEKVPTPMMTASATASPISLEPAPFAPTTGKRRTGRAARFPGKLHDLMNFAEETGLESVISWELNGRGIKINHPELLVEQILPLFFEQTKYRSFRRQLNMWHFQRISKGPHKGTFVHPYFVKHDRELSTLMSRNIELKPCFFL